jgi:hypothetical protein
MYTNLVDEKTLKYHLIEKLKELHQLTNSGDLLIGNSLIKDPVQKIVSSNQEAGWFSSAFMPIIIAGAVDCEKFAPGSGRIFLNLVTNCLGNDIRKSITYNINSDVLSDALLEIKTSSIDMCLEDDFISFKQQTLDNDSRRIVDDVLDIYRLGDSVVVEKSLLRSTQIQKTHGYYFDNVSTNSSFLSGGSWNRNNVNVVIIDGVIESVGEIYHLLDAASNDKESYLIICSGILPEPLSVVQNNFQRKTIDVVVTTVNSDEFSIQTMVDLGTCCMTEPISAMKGETISQTIRRGTIKVDRIELNHKSVNIKNEIAKNATDNLLVDIIKRSENNSDIAFLFQKRVRSLSSSKIKVSIGRDDVDKDKSVIENVDIFFRSCPISLKSGFIKKNEIKTLPDEIIALLFGKTDVQPVYRTIKALEAYVSTRDQINRTGIVIENHRE